MTTTLWQPIETAPRDGTLFIAVTEVFSARTGNFFYHDMHIVWCNDETGELHDEAYQGWVLEDYIAWQPAPVPPPVGYQP